MAEQTNGTSAVGGSLTPSERARWPWVAFAFFVFTLAAEMVFHVLNGLEIANTIAFVLAFSMFAVVGLVVVTRDPRNRIGLLLLVGSLIMVACSAAGDFATWAIAQGYSGPVVAIPGLTTNFGWLLGLLAPLLLIPLLFPDGHLPSPRWRPFLWCCIAFITIIGLNLLFGQRLLGGSGDDAGVRNPLYIQGLDSVTLDPFIADPARVVRPLGVLADPAVPAFDRRGTPTDQVGGLRPAAVGGAVRPQHGRRE